MNPNNNSLIQRIVDMVVDIDNYNFDMSNYSFYEKLSELTLLVWENGHEQLLHELKNLESPFGTDYQLLWYDSLGFPQEIPKTYNKSGKPIYVCYGTLPCKQEQEVMYHDASIMHFYLHENSLHILLDTCEGNKEVIFQNVTTILKKIDSSGFTECNESDFNSIVSKNITSGYEIPAIDYIFCNLKIPSVLSFPDQRYFLLNTSYSSLPEILVIFSNYYVDISS